MRPRRKSREINPQFRHNTHLQGQRIFDQLTKDTPLYFTQDEVTGNGVSFNHNVRPVPRIGVPEILTTDETEKYLGPNEKRKFGMNFSKFSNNRTSTQGLNTFHVKPRRMIDCLGKPTQFKAATGISCGQELSYKVERHELQNEFSEVAGNLEFKRQQMC